MGCMQSKAAGVVKKDVSDRALGQVKFSKVGIKDFDGVFQSADDPLNKVALLNNSILQAQENVSDAVLATSGKYYAARLSAGPAKVVINEVTDKKETPLTAEQIAAIETLNAPYNTVVESLAAFNAVVEATAGASAGVEVVNNRLVVKDTEVAEAAANVNNALFLLRKATRKASGQEAAGFKDVLKEAAKLIAKGGSKVRE
jgi:hypothetical protein